MRHDPFERANQQPVKPPVKAPEAAANAVKRAAKLFPLGETLDAECVERMLRVVAQLLAAIGVNQCGGGRVAV